MLPTKCIINSVKLHILASFSKESLLILECIGVTYAGMNNGKVCKPINCADQVSQCEKFANKVYSASHSNKTYMPIKKRREELILRYSRLTIFDSL